MYEKHWSLKEIVIPVCAAAHSTICKYHKDVNCSKQQLGLGVQMLVLQGVLRAGEVKMVNYMQKNHIFNVHQLQFNSASNYPGPDESSK